MTWSLSGSIEAVLFSMQQPCLRYLVLFALGLGALPGCARPGQGDLVPVEGSLLVEGRPAANAQLAFHPLNQMGSGTVIPVGTTAVDGHFRLMTYGAGDGAPVGGYVVTIVWPDSLGDECADPAGHDRLQGRYADRSTSPLRAVIQRGSNGLILHATAGQGSWSLPRMRDVGEKP